MRHYQFYLTGVFTDQPFGGNPTLIFPEAHGLNEAEMQQVARTMNLSRTAFALPPTSDDADVMLRVFTPMTELPVAGQPSLGAHIVLATLGHYEIAGPVTRIWQQTRAGVFAVDLVTDGAGVTNRAVMTQPEARHGDIYEDSEALADALNLSTSDLHPDLPAQVYATGLPGLIIPLTSLEAVRRIRLNIGKAAEICKATNVIGGGLYAFSLETEDGAHHAHARSFDPLTGIYEDPATGSMAGALGAYLLGKGVFDYEAEASTTHMVVEQGYEIGRPSLIEVEVDIREGAVDEVRVSGQVVMTAEGSFNLD